MLFGIRLFLKKIDTNSLISEVIKVIYHFKMSLKPQLTQEGMCVHRVVFGILPEKQIPDVRIQGIFTEVTLVYNIIIVEKLQELMN